MLSVETQRQLEDLLVSSSALTKEKLEQAKLDSLKANEPLISFLVKQGLVDDEQMTKLQAKVAEVPYVNLSNVNVPTDLLALLPKEVAENYMAVPFGDMQSRLAVAMIDPTNIQAVDYISRKSARSINVYMASRASIERVLAQYRSNVSADVNEAISGVATENEPRAKDVKPDAKQLQTLVQDAPITRALNAILDFAAQNKASDIHIEPREKELHIRYRIDGILQDTMTLPKSIEPALVSRLKIMSNLKIDEHRIPQDGQFKLNSGGHDIDLRVAISPVVNGEQIVIRLLDKSGTKLTLESLGFRGRAFRVINEGIHRPHGMTLSTGPTGSGKSTTLYALIEAIKDDSINIVTLEDPVEYKMDGINQIQVNVDAGLTFASGLRSILRQDPNVVMVGEIRDKETAELAVQAALTGHVVLSTIHTNSAAGVLPRLLDMGIEPFLISSTVNTVIGQRLVRKLCEKCRVEAKSNALETESITKTIGPILPKSQDALKAAIQDLGYDNLPLAGQSAYTLYKPKGCSACTKGYKGRIGIYEVFGMSSAMEKLLVARASTNEVQEQTQAEGMLTMKQDGYLKVLTGLTTLEEVARVASDF